MMPSLSNPAWSFFHVMALMGHPTIGLSNPILEIHQIDAAPMLAFARSAEARRTQEPSGALPIERITKALGEYLQLQEHESG